MGVSQPGSKANKNLHVTFKNEQKNKLGIQKEEKREVHVSGSNVQDGYYHN